MFVLLSTHQKVQAALDFAAKEYMALLKEWNALIERINAKGGEDFLHSKNKQFTAEEIRTLVKLCHPDKHGGDKDAEAITKKLLAMRK